MAPTGTVSVSLVEDDEAYAEMLQELFGRAPFELVAHYGDGESALRDLPQRPPQVVIVDLGLPGMGGSALIAQLARQLPESVFLVLSAILDDEAIFAALRAGAVGYLLKGASAREIQEGVLAACAGGSPISPGIARKVVAHFQAQAKPPQPPPPALDAQFLSVRERTVLDSLATGLRNKEVAAQLNVSEHTVRTYVRRAFAKLQATSRAEAVAKLYRD